MTKGACIAGVKIIGVASLGLLTTSLTYQSIETIPLIINDLIKSVNPLSNGSVISNKLDSIRSIILNSRLLNLAFSGLTFAFFTMGYHYSDPSGKHPYLLYAAFGAPLTIGSVYYQAYKYEEKILKLQQETKAKKISKQKKSQSHKEKHPQSVVKSEVPSIQTPQTKSVESSAVDIQSENDHEQHDDLGKSYIYVSDGSSSASSVSSTPNASVPNSPQVTHQTGDEEINDESQHKQQEQQEETLEKQDNEPKEDSSESIDNEIEVALTKKEFIKDLQELKSSYIIGSTISGFSLFIATIGLIGDYYLL
ncbi:Chromodomain-helicase DNA-binding protein [Scheffersomyces amazonensis]|uniref:Chromodomain-helicase DNA-binding protein n=1 Tax=Scheffersomyces amazonensis TaxID=1078765 RepID=UPI00315E0146